MQGINSLLNSPSRSQISLQDLHNQIHPQPPLQFDSPVAGGVSGGDDFLQQILSGAPSWPHGGDDDDHGNSNNTFHFDESAALASKLRHHQISSPSAAKLLLHHQFVNSDFKSPNQGGVGVGDGSVQALFNGFAAAPNQHHQHFHSGSVQTYAPPGSAATSQNPQPTGGGAPAQPRQRVRARRGQATDPHSIAERLRRERIAERMKALQELVPNANKTDKASMLDEIIDYVKFLQLQVKVLSMSRLGGAGAVAPLVADISSEAGGGGGGGGDSSAATGGDDVDGLTMTESQVAKLMEEDMGSAMQYLQGKGLCLMPISLATAISTRNNNPSPNPNPNPNPNPLMSGLCPSSPSISALTGQSSAAVADANLRDSASVSKP